MNKLASGDSWTDPDDAPEWTEAMFEAAEYAVGGKVVRGRAKLPAILVADHETRPRGIVSRVFAVADKKGVPSNRTAKSTSKVLKDGRTGKDSKAAAGSALSQKPPAKKKPK